MNINGPGFVALTGSANQFNVTGTNRLNLIGGTLRGNNTNIGFTSSGSGVIAFRGGVLEITGGSDGTGASADFTRPINNTNTAGDTNWASSTSGDAVGGSGGFSAFGSAASVNLGGSATPSGLTWGSTGSGFVQDGQALIFGSTKSNARLDFLNPVALDGGTSGNYNVREVKVIGGVGGDATRIVGTISGSATTDLEKTGTGALQLSAANSYAGNTLIQGGTLALVGAGTTGTGNLSFASGTTFDISAASANVTFSSTQSLLGTGTIVTGANTLVLNGNFSPGFGPGSLAVNGNLQMGGHTELEIDGNLSAAFDQIIVSAGGKLSFGSSTIDLLTNYTPTVGDSIDLVSLGGGATITGTPTFTGTSLPGNLQWDTSNFDTTGEITAVAVPEPSSFAIGFGAAVLAVVAWRRSRRVSTTSV